MIGKPDPGKKPKVSGGKRSTTGKRAAPKRATGNAPEMPAGRGGK